MFSALIKVAKNLPTVAKVVGGSALAVGAAYGAKKLYDRWSDGPKGTTTKRKPAKKKKKASPKRKKALSQVKKAADKLKKSPSKKNIKKAIAEAQKAGINIPAAVVAAADKV